jgi:hypothetical protein
MVTSLPAAWPQRGQRRPDPSLGRQADLRCRNISAETAKSSCSMITILQCPTRRTNPTGGSHSSDDPEQRAPDAGQALAGDQPGGGRDRESLRQGRVPALHPQSN